MRKVRIGAAQGFYGDSILPAIETAERGDVQYICFDTLAELTLAILQKDRQKDPAKGYTKDITTSMEALLPYVRDKGLKILTNAGGINPLGAQEEVMRIAQKLGIRGLKVAVVTGDDVLNRLNEFRKKGISLDHMEDGRRIDSVLEHILFANAYLGCRPIVEALKQGADIVLTGRTTDSAQFLAPLVYEFGWEEDDWNKLAHGVLMGHLMECSGQVTGGNFSGKWQKMDDLDHIGFPIAEVADDGAFMITKPENTGGLVSVDTVKEQLVYEIHDPKSYITPDVILDITEVVLADMGSNRVSVTGAKGKERPNMLKVVMGYEDGWLGQSTVGYSWPDALSKAQASARIIIRQIERLRVQYDEIRTDYLGYNSLHGPLAQYPEKELNEVYLRMAIRTGKREDAAKLTRLFPPLGLNGPPGMSGFSGMVSPRQLLGMWSCLVPRTEVEGHVQVKIKEVN